MTDKNEPSLDLVLIGKLVVGIGEVAEITGIPQRQIRYWDKKGIIQSVSSPDGSTRRYDYLNIKRIIFLKELLDDGFTLTAATQKMESRLKAVQDAFRKMCGQEDPQ